MCGIGGWQVKHGERRLIPLAAAMFVLMDKRGGDSWGYWICEKPDCPEGRVFRGLGDIALGVPARSVKNALTMMFHTRAASVGKVSIPNAHPFTFGNITGLHNGAIYNWEDLNKEYGRKFEVDSMHIFAHLNEKKPMSELRGYGAFTYFDNRLPGKVYMGKFNNGDLAAARLYIKDEPFGIAWCSTEDALIAALGVAGIPANGIKLEQNKMYYAQGGELYKMEVNGAHVEIPIGFQRYKETKTHFPYKDTPAPEVKKEDQAKESLKLELLHNNHPELFVLLKKKQIKGGHTVWVDDRKHTYNKVGHCYFCRGAEAVLKPVTYFGGYLKNDLCVTCTIAARVDEWWNKSTPMAGSNGDNTLFYHE